MENFYLRARDGARRIGLDVPPSVRLEEYMQQATTYMHPQVTPIPPDVWRRRRATIAVRDEPAESIHQMLIEANRDLVGQGSDG